MSSSALLQSVQNLVFCSSLNNENINTKSRFVFCFKLSEYQILLCFPAGPAVLAPTMRLLVLVEPGNVVTQVSFIEAIHQVRVSVSTEKHPMCSRSHLHLHSLHYIRPLFGD